jgi:3-methyladenine DNA glycosylase/8-oxoguanine DNA glycosylase
MAKVKKLSLVRRYRLYPKAPFHFDGTVYKPSHFPTPDNDYKTGRFWTTMRIDNYVFGILLVNSGTIWKPCVEIMIYGQKDVRVSVTERLIYEIQWRFGFDEDIRPFIKLCGKDPLIAPVLRRFKGMRVKCCQSLYEFLMIAVVLQNATIRRTTQMMTNLFDLMGTQLEFDEKILYGFWAPVEAVEKGEDRLRAIKLGYRAKTITRLSEQFLEKNINEKSMRTWTNDQLRETLLSLYGIGPASVWYILFEVFRRYDALETISPWEQKIYSRLIFNEQLVPVEDIRSTFTERWGKWRMLAAHYLFEDLFWRYKAGKAEWLDELIRL